MMSSSLNRRGNVTALTPEISQRLVALIRAGHSMTAASRMVGFGPEAAKKWMGRGKDPNAPEIYRTFREAVLRSRHMHERRLLGRIDNASRDPKHWAAAAWILERRYPERYSLIVTRAIELEREAALSELAKRLDERTFQEVAKALVIAQQVARGTSSQRRALPAPLLEPEGSGKPTIEIAPTVGPQLRPRMRGWERAWTEARNLGGTVERYRETRDGLHMFDVKDGEVGIEVLDGDFDVPDEADAIEADDDDEEVAP